MQYVPQLRTSIESLTSKTFRDIYEALEDKRYQFMLDHINSIMNKDLVVHRGGAGGQIFQRINCVQDGVNQLLDLSRTIYKDLITEVKGKVKVI